MNKFLKFTLTISGLLLALLLAVAGQITIFGMIDNYKSADLIVIFGNEVKTSGEMSDRLMARVKKGQELYENGYAGKILVSGGVGKEGFDEAVVVKDYLVKEGVKDEDVLVDSAGVNTLATAQNAARIMRENDWKSVILVSQFFHLARANFSFEKVGVSTIYTAHPDFFETRDIYSLFREVFALYFYQAN